MVTRILGVIALTGWMGAANATLIFDFSWDSDNGEIIGEIYGLSDNGENMEASGFVLTSVGGTFVNIDVFDLFDWSIDDNAFDVLAGEVGDFRVHSSDYSVGGTGYLVASRNANYFLIEYMDPAGKVYVGLDSGSYVKRVTAPEPSSVILLLLGLAGLSFARYRKQY
jgi:hypothetical protein